MNRILLPLVLLLTGLSMEGAAPSSEFALGQSCYEHGEFNKAVAHFRRVVAASPDDAAPYFWIGKSYEALADIALPFAGKYVKNARVNLTKATELAPDRQEYRKELFDLLLDSACLSRSALREAEAILQAMSPDDLDYVSMSEQFQQKSQESAKPEARLARLFLALPQAAYRIADVVANPLSPRQR